MPPGDIKPAGRRRVRTSGNTVRFVHSVTLAPSMAAESQMQMTNQTSPSGACRFALVVTAALAASACTSSPAPSAGQSNGTNGQTNAALDQTVLGTGQSFAVLAGSTV